MEKVKLYKQNGDIFCGCGFTANEAKVELKRAGYSDYYIGRDSYDNMLTIVGINENNTVGLLQRRKNGLLRAKSGKL